MSDVEYVALVPIDYEGVRAYQPGDKVPASNVELHGYEVGEQVEAVPVLPPEPDPEPGEGQAPAADEPSSPAPGEGHGQAEESEASAKPKPKPARAR